MASSSDEVTRPGNAGSAALASDVARSAPTNRFRLVATATGKPAATSSSSRASKVRLCASDLPKPTPGSIQTSSTPPSRAALARATRASRTTDITSPSEGSSGSAPCTAIHPAPASAAIGHRAADMSLMRVAPAPRATAAISASVVWIDTRTRGARAPTTAATSALTSGSAPVTSTMSAPSAASSKPRATISSGEPIIPPRCKTPMTSGDTALSVLVPFSPSRR